MQSCPVELKPFEKAHQMRLEAEDFARWMQGAYIYEAVGVAVGNILGGKHSKKLEYRKKSFSQEMNESKANEEMTEEEKIRRTKQLFRNLEIMQHNFERNHPKKEIVAEE